jgi:23S rRNA (guanine2445-N2)-methyltransferase / 23S rRNA (guanine2069-N7)-methyltransferase
MQLLAISARGTEEVVERELTALGAEQVQRERGLVRFEGTLELGYRVVMFARSPSRVLLPIARFGTGDPDALYASIRALAWNDHLGPSDTLAVECVLASDVAGHSRYLVQRTKDAICDYFRAKHGVRPSVDRVSPHVRVHVHVGAGETGVSLDLSGGALHRRGYRSADAADGARPEAPLKETLAAALLLMARWDEHAARGEPLVDLLCGSGTFAIEGALIARDIAPGLLRAERNALSLPGWRGHDAKAFARVLAEARERAQKGRERKIRIVGYDRSAQAIALARKLAGRAAVLDSLQLEVRALDHASAPDGPAGLVLANPPYGERLGDPTELVPLYEQLGDALRRRFIGYSAFVLTGSRLLAKQLGLRAARKIPIWNGPIECRLLELPIASEAPRAEHAPGFRKPSAEAGAFENRLRKNLRSTASWAEREQIECYRLYDADLPEYNVAIDIYGSGDSRHAVLQEYAAPRSIDPEVATRRLRDVRLLLPELLGIDAARVILKVRKRQTQGGQYERRGDSVRLAVREGELSFWVELEGHLDTGLFGDHRVVRKLVAREAEGKSLLNLFAYTCSASVAAAKRGAQTTSVDLSGRYLAWGKENLARNELALTGHRFVQEDALSFLRRDRARYRVVLANPPSYSRSHRMQSDFDVQRDHAELLLAAAARLEPEGVLFFSTHARGFSLAEGLEGRLARDGLVVHEISARAVPKDFARSPFRAYRIGRSRG